MLTLLPFAGLAQEGELSDKFESDAQEQEGDTLAAPVAKGIVVSKYTLGQGITFSSPKNDYSMTLSGYVQSSFESRRYEGDDEFYNRFRLRRLRVRLAGDAMDSRLSYRFTGDFAQSAAGDDEVNGMLMDAFVKYDMTQTISVTFGQRSTSTDNREMSINSSTLQFTDRSKLSSLFSSVREVGFFVDGSFKVGKIAYLRPSVTITDGDGSYSFSKRYGGLKYGSRVNYLPFGLFRQAGEYSGADITREVSPKLSVGAAFSYNDGVSDRRGRESGAILYMNDDNKYALPDYQKLVVDFLFKYRGFTALGEFVKTWAHVPGEITQRVRNDGSTSRDFKLDDGRQSVTDYIKNRMMLGDGFNLQAGYLFKNRFAVNGRYTHIRPDKYSFLNNTLYYNRNNYYEVSAAKYLTKSHSVKVQASAIWIDAGEGSRKVNSETMEGNEFLFQALVQISF